MREEVGMYTEKSGKMGKKLLSVGSAGEWDSGRWGEEGVGMEKRNFTFHLIPFSTV